MILLFFFFFLLSSFSSKSYGADTLETGKSIRDGESLISAGEVFELGFFSPGSSKNRYVGIWYSNINQTVVWVANKEDPARDISGSFSLREDGSLAVLDGESKVLWSSNASSSTNDTSAQLLDTGNFMVRSHVSGDVWQSFNHPGDTYLPGMKVGRTNFSTVVVSSKSTDDPSSGTFSIGVDPRRSIKMIRDGETPVWRSGPWDEQVFIGIQSMRSTQYRYGFKFSNVEAEQKSYVWYTAPPESKVRFVMTSSGVGEYRVWSDEKEEWRLLEAYPNGECELFNRCGDHGICDETFKPICSCLHGFKPYFPDEWSKGNWSGGCSRRIPLECQRNSSNTTEQEGDGFLKLERLKLPDADDLIPNVYADPNACKDICWKNCSCEAYAYVRGIGCMTWGPALLDIQQFTSGGQDLYIKLAGPELEGRPSEPTL